MKKIILGIFLSLFLVTNIHANTNREITCSVEDRAKGCDQCFESAKLRYGSVYNLFDNIQNSQNSDIYVDYVDVNFSRGALIHNGEIKPAYSSWIKGKNYILKAGESGRLMDINDYSIDNIPSEGRKKNNIFLEYITGFKLVQNGQGVGETREHKECQPYEITWCGDGVLDPEETCDPNDPNKTGWGTGGCDQQTCKPKTTPLECKALTSTPKIGENPLTSTFSCDATNAPANATYKIDIISKGNIINTINSKTGSYTFENPGTYLAKCTVNNTITSPSCEQVVTVNQKPTPQECKALTATPKTGETPFNTSFTCDGTNIPTNSTYKIDIMSGGNVISTINSKTGVYNFTEAGTYTAKCTINGNITSSACEQVITAKPKPKPEAKCVDLQVSNFSVEKGQTSTFTCNAQNTENYKIKIVDDKGTIIKEIFGKTGTHTFEKTGNYIASCYVDNKTTTEETCVKPVSVTEPIIPRIEVDKRDNNQKDLDGNIGNDTQTINFQDKAVFKITVRNDGTEDLEKISLKDDVIESDVDAPMCDKTEAQVNEILQTKFGRTYLKPGESFDYTCERANEIKDPETYTNKITVDGQGKVSLRKVKDEDPTIVNKPKEPKIKVDKRDNNPNDLDKVIGDNDSQTIKETDKAVFKITVRNNGTEDLKDVFLVDDVLGTDVDAPNCDKSIDEVNNILKTIGNKDTIFNVGETFDYTCERANHKNDSNPYTNLIKVTGTGVTSGKKVNDEDPTEVKKEEEPKIKVDKTDKNPEDLDKNQGNDTQTVLDQAGKKAIFKITVSNNGTEDLVNINLKDDVIESDVDAPMCDKSVNDINKILQAKFGRTYLKPGESFDYTCERENQTKDPIIYKNKIYVEGEGKISLKKVRNDDDTEVKKGSECRKLDVDFNNKTFKCDGGREGYKIIFKDSFGKEIQRISNTNISGIFTGDFKNISNVNKVECLNGEETVAKKECTVTDTGGGSAPDRCINLTIDNNKKEFECKGTGRGFKVVFKDSNGNILKTLDSSNIELFKGNYGNISNLKTVECLHSYETVAKDNCRINIPGGGGGTPPTPPTNPPSPNIPVKPSNPKDYCGDGKVQRPSKNNPNGNGNEEVWEECDSKGTITFYKNGKEVTERWCTDECKLRDPLTFPGESSFKFYPEKLKIVGKNMRPYEVYQDIIPYIENTNSTEGGLYVEQICVTTKSNKENGGFIKGNSFDKKSICSDPVDINGNISKNFNPGTKLYMKDTSGLREFIAKEISRDKSKNPNAEKKYEDNVFVTTIVTGSDSETKANNGKSARNNPIYQDTRFLSSADKLVIRVTDSSVKTTGGGINYINGGNISDVSKITESRENLGKNYIKPTNQDNKNFVGTSLTDFLTSYSKGINGNASKTEVGKVKDEILNNNNNKTSSIDTNGSFKEYNGITGAYIVKGSYKFKQEDLDLYSGPKTYIIEGGDLTIEKDITHSHNIAFVVKGGNIIIKENVTNLNGTYIAIKISEKGGAIEGENSGKQLVVSGSLYGNISNLIENRTYMKVNDGGQVDVGTVVSYGSSVFRKPAPLISTFVDEYVKSTKVAQ